MSYYETIKAMHDYIEAKGAVETTRNALQGQIGLAKYIGYKRTHAGRTDYVFPTSEEVNSKPEVVAAKQEYDEALAKFNRLVGIATVIGLANAS